MDGFIGEVRLFTWGSYAPEQWLLCNGSLQDVRQYQALYSIIGNTYGGNFQQNTFAVPNLQGSCVAGAGQGPELTLRVAQTGGADTVQLNINTVPTHNHTLLGRAAPVKNTLATPANTTMLGRLGVSPSTVRYAYYAADTPTKQQPMAAQMLSPFIGGSQAHENRQPFLAMSYCICWQGEYPVFD